MAEKYPPLRINQELATSLHDIQTAPVPDARQALGRLLQNALQLEFATIPTYLSAAFSLKPSNIKIYELILRAAIEEMLHMTAVANLMNAIGIAPDIAAAVPEYPCKLKVLDPPLELNLCSFSLDLVEKLFMQIEAPEERVEYPVFAAEERPETIGQFYAQIIEIIKQDAIPGLFENAARDKYKQIQARPNFSEIAYASNEDAQRYPLKPDLDFMIGDPASAVRHLSWVVDQGEGEDVYKPLTAEGIPGHHYRFESILRRRYLIKDETVPNLGYSFSGGDLPFDSDGVYEFEANAKTKNYINHPDVMAFMQIFNDNYTRMINLLEKAFNCPSPDQEQQSTLAYENALGCMRRMPGQATDIVQTAQSSGIKAGIPFEYARPLTS